MDPAAKSFQKVYSAKNQLYNAYDHAAEFIIVETIS